MVSETTTSFQALAQTQNKTFTCQILPMLSLTGDEKAIRQLVSILLDNALKYFLASGTVFLSLGKQNKVLVLSVTNTKQNPIPRESLSVAKSYCGSP